MKISQQIENINKETEIIEKNHENSRGEKYN